jgi:hypothetical protein
LAVHVVVEEQTQASAVSAAHVVIEEMTWGAPGVEGDLPRGA